MTKTGNITLEARSCNRCDSGKAISITYFECVFVALGIQRAMRMGHIILSYVACPALQYCSALSHKRHDFRKKVTEYKMCFDYLCTVCPKHLPF
jgi:hypothetical protein